MSESETVQTVKVKKVKEAGVFDLLGGMFKSLFKGSTQTIEQTAPKLGGAISATAGATAHFVGSVEQKAKTLHMEQAMEGITTRKEMQEESEMSDDDMKEVMDIINFA